MTKINELHEAVTYARISTQQQSVKGDGLSSQTTRCTQFAKMKGLKVIKEFHDVISGGTIERPGMDAMLAYLEENRARKLTVLIDDLSRLARGLEQHLALRTAINDTGAQLASPSIEFGEDPDSILVENLLASVAQHHKQKNGVQAKTRMISRMMNGYWVHPQPPVGYVYGRKHGVPGKVLLKDEPLASIVKEMLEGYACGRFQTKAECRRFLERFPEFPRDKHGNVRNQRVQDLLTHCLYPGMVVNHVWKVSLRKGQHEPIIDIKTHLKIKERLEGKSKPVALKRANKSEKFPLRGYVRCHKCGSAMTAGTSTGRTKKYDYYHCYNRKCGDLNKTVARTELHAQFEQLLTKLTPSHQVIATLEAMLRDTWEAMALNQTQRRRALAKDVANIDKELSKIMDRIVEAESGTLIKALERKIEKLEDDKRLKEEMMNKLGVKKPSFEMGFRTALTFLRDVGLLWDTGDGDVRSDVLKFTFADPLRYCQKEGLRTAKTSLPFSVLAGFGNAANQNDKLAEREGFEPSMSF